MNLFAQHTTYDVEQLKENKKFLMELVSDLEQFYFTFNKQARDHKDKTFVSFSPTRGTIHQVHLSVGNTNAITISFGGILSEQLRKDFMVKYPKSCSYMGTGISVEMGGITRENVSSFMPDIVLLLEKLGFTPIR